MGNAKHARNSEDAVAPVHRRRRPLVGTAALTAIAAWAGAVGLISGSLDLTAPIEHRLPFRSPAFGAFALAVVVAVPCSVAAWLAWHRDQRAGIVAEAAGWLLVGWIVIEVCVIRSFSVLQPACAGLGMLLIALGRRARQGP